RSIEGREEDIIRLPDGRRLTWVYFAHLFKDFPQVRYYQVVQQRVDDIFIRIVPASGRSQAEMSEVREVLQHDLGERVRLTLQLVEQIPLAPSGKKRVV